MLHGICHGLIGPPRGFAGRSLLGRITVPVKSLPAGGTDSFATRLTPNLAVGDIVIASVAIAPSNATLVVRGDTTFYANVFGSKIPQSLQADAYSATLASVYGEGTLLINDRPPVPANGKNFVGNTAFALKAPITLTLNAVDPDGDPITWSVQSGVLPTGLSLSSSGVLSGTPTVLGSYGFTIRVADPYGAYTDVVDSAVVVATMPRFIGQQLSVAQVTVANLGLTETHSSVSSTQPSGQIIAQVPPDGTPITSSTTAISFQVSNGSGYVGLTTLFPTNILGLTWNGTREIDFTTNFNEAITGKASTGSFTKYPTIIWDLNYELLDQTAAQDDLKKIFGLFNQQQAQATSFLYQDPAFNSVTNEVFFVGDGTTKTAQLTAAYGVPGGPGLPEIIQSLNGTPALTDTTSSTTLVAGTDYTIGATGLVTFTVAPASGHQIAWTGNFYYICKFVVDNIDPQQFATAYWQLHSIKFRSVIV